jgi:2'-5' RNA ligase
MEKLGFVREDRPFTPHLTLARFKIPRPQPALQSHLERLGEPSLGSFKVSEFFLFESKLSPQGAEYRKLARFPQ